MGSLDQSTVTPTVHMWPKCSVCCHGLSKFLTIIRNVCKPIYGLRMPKEAFFTLHINVYALQMSPVCSAWGENNSRCTLFNNMQYAHEMLLSVRLRQVDVVRK